MRQVEATTTDWRKRRQALREQLTAAFADGDFAEVPVHPFAEAETGAEGFPATAEIDEKLVEAYAQGRQAKLTCDDQIALQMQANLLEAYRRNLASQRQGRRELLAHLAVELEQMGKAEALLLEQIAGVARARP